MVVQLVLDLLNDVYLEVDVSATVKVVKNLNVGGTLHRQIDLQRQVKKPRFY
jgi:hypothetical protein